jgi:hypothetical protein
MYIPLVWVFGMMGMPCGLLLGLDLVIGDLGEMDRSLDRLGVGYKMRYLGRDRIVSYEIIRFYQMYLIVSLVIITRRRLGIVTSGFDKWGKG